MLSKKRKAPDLVGWVPFVLEGRNSVDIVYKKIKDIHPYEKNPRRNDDAAEYVAESIREFGFKVPIVLDSNNIVVAGHTRLKAAKKLGYKEVPCIVADDLTEEQVKAFRLADNKVSEAAEWDFDLLSEELDDLLDFDMAAFGFDIPDPIDEDMDDDGNGEKANERERTYKSYNMEWFHPDETEGRYEMPTLAPCDKIPKKMLGFNYAMSSNEYDACIHFYLDDYQFERLWNQPEKYIDVLCKYDMILTPHYSVYYDMAQPVKIWNVYRGRLLGQIFQSWGMDVVPIVYCSDPRTWDYCFDGLPENSTLSINTIGNNMPESWDMWHAGVDELIRRKKPKTLLIYGNGIEVEHDFGDVNVIYYKNDVTERMKNRGD